jgi:hypothetical protein
MRKLILMVIAILGVAFTANTQTRPTEVTPDGYISGASYVYIFGTTSDTLTNADTLTSVIRVKGTYAQDFNIKLWIDHVSGTAGGNLWVTQSMDGVTYVPAVGDTITASSVTGDIMDTETINKSGFLYPYLKFYYIQTGTAVTIPRVYIYTKPN